MDDPLIAHMVQVAGNWSIGLKKTAYFATDGQGRQYAVGDATGHDMTVDGYYSLWGGKYAGGTLNAASFGADRSSSASMKQLSFFRNRFYDQQTGRWTQEDPLGVAGGVNLYQFNGNNPVSNTDPFGLCPIEKDGVPCTLTMAGTGVVGGALSGALIGAGGGTLVVPGVGTVAGGGSGAVVGGTTGLVAGGIVGAARDVTSLVEMTGLGKTIQRKVRKAVEAIGLIIAAYTGDGPPKRPDDDEHRPPPPAPTSTKTLLPHEDREP